MSEEVSDVLMQKAKYHGYEEGFDAAIALDLPVKFAEWSNTLLRTKKDNYSLFMLPEVSKQDRGYTTKELYEYWRDNVYKPEV